MHLGLVSPMLWMAAASAPQATPEGKADPAAVVVSGQARFTVLTPALIRMEWSPTGRFVDRASFAFVNRRLPVPKFTVHREGGTLVINTGELMLRYAEGSGRFVRETLSIDFALKGQPMQWRPGDVAGGNLAGTTRTLDGVSGACPLEPGLMSRDGWTLVEDTSLLFDETGWVAPRAEATAKDWYFWGYGRDYKRVLADFITVAGRIPMPPRFAFGAWWSRYWAYSDEELRRLVAEFGANDVPLDVLVIDMDWHLDGWTGYTWNPKYFPDPAGFLTWVHEQGLRATLNLHPADGVGPHEAAYEDMCRAMGRDAAQREVIAFDATDRRYMDAYFKHLHHPLEAQGVDFWWTDWQQGRESKLAGLDPLFWLNHLHFTDMERRAAATGRRPLIFSRWGGLGNHRYQIGFSGDTYCDWRSLAFQPYFTATAGNVGYAYWSHDIGGHQPGIVDPELYARWIQWGALSPVLRTHTTKNPDAERRLWAFPTPVFEAAREAFHLRYELIPYLYTAARQCYDSGLPLCRPLYYEWPELGDAYSFTNEYLLGDDLLVAPVTEPADPVTGCAVVRVWFPPGKWSDWFTGRTYHGPSISSLLVPLDQVPLFVRSGRVIPGAPRARRTQEMRTDELILHVWPGGTGSTRLYEDDGLSNGYRDGAFAWTTVTHGANEAGHEIIIGESVGTYAGQPDRRRYELRFHDQWPPQAVTVDGTDLHRSTPGTAPGWWYDADQLAVVVRTPALSTAGIHVVRVVGYPGQPGVSLAAGLRGWLGMVDRLVRELGEAAPAALREAAALRQRIASEEQTASVAAARFHENGGEVVRAVASASLEGPRRQAALQRLLNLAAVVRPQGVSGTGLRAEIEVTRSPHFISPPALEVTLSTQATPPWKLVEVEPAAGHAVPPEQLFRRLVDVTPEGAMDTGVVEANVHVSGGGVSVDLPLRWTLLPSISRWWVIGPFDAPFDKSLDQAFPPESEVDVRKAYAGKGGEVRWREVERPLGSPAALSDEFNIDLHALFGGRVYEAVAYGLTYLHVPRDMAAVIALGTDDGNKVWLNGQEVHRSSIGRSYVSKQDRVAVTLKKGVNTLLIKITQGGGDWRFGAHVETPQGRPLPEVRAGLKP